MTKTTRNMPGVKDLNKKERAALDAVARLFSATCEMGGDPPAAGITVAGKKVAVDLTTLKERGMGLGTAAQPRLRFDKVATRFIERLQTALAETVPDSMNVLLTITAPIRLPAKTAASLADNIQILIARGSPVQNDKITIHGNRVRIRLLGDTSEGAPKLIGFVHNSDSDPLLLLDMTRELLERRNFEKSSQARGITGERWHIVRCAGESSRRELYRYIHSQLRSATDYKKILMVFGDGNVGTLKG